MKSRPKVAKLAEAMLLGCDGCRYAGVVTMMKPCREFVLVCVKGGPISIGCEERKPW